jgi:hypothetical protein
LSDRFEPRPAINGYVTSAVADAREFVRNLREVEEA